MNGNIVLYPQERAVRSPFALDSRLRAFGEMAFLLSLRLRIFQARESHTYTSRFL